MTLIIQRWLVSAVLVFGVLSGCIATDSSSRLRESRQPVSANNTEISSAAPCAEQIARGLVCETANRRALELMQVANLQAITVVQNASTGALVAFAAADPIKLDVSTPLPPLSVVKLMLAACWWDHGLPENPEFPDVPRLSIHEMIVNGSDNFGRRMASALRKSIGTEQVLADLNRYGFPSREMIWEPTLEVMFWTEPPKWQTRLIPALAYTSLTSKASDRDWEDTLSIGEARFTATALHVSRFLQAVGNDGVMLQPTARIEPSNQRELRPTRVMQSRTAVKLQAGMRDVVQRGTAKSIANVLTDTGWQMGGKTGSGLGAPIGPQSDGWFAGLIFDPRGKARFTVATFVRRGGLGGGNAAKISAQVARYLIGAK
jgi:cell division protein FtsI/penicillin-binding protein 2